jgi:hypothetical protein
MLDILQKYGGVSKLKEIIVSLHESVVQKPETRHFLFNTNTEDLFKNQLIFLPFILPKNERLLKKGIAQTAPPNVRIGPSQFEEIVQMFRAILIKEYKVAREDVLILVATILELIEETRSQKEDLTLTTWKSIDINVKTFDSFFTKKGLISKIQNSNEISILSGIDYPVGVEIVASNKTIGLSAQAKSKPEVSPDALSELFNKMNSDTARIALSLNKEGPDSVLSTKFSMPYDKGIPTRLFVKAIHDFAALFCDTLEKDADQLFTNKSQR